MKIFIQKNNTYKYFIFPIVIFCITFLNVDLFMHFYSKDVSDQIYYQAFEDSWYYQNEFDPKKCNDDYFMMMDKYLYDGYYESASYIDESGDVYFTGLSDYVFGAKLTPTQDLYIWSEDNSHAQLGIGTITPNSYTSESNAVKIYDHKTGFLYGKTDVKGHTFDGIQDVSLGGDQVTVLTTWGTLIQWGNPKSLGYVSTGTALLSPTKIFKGNPESTGYWTDGTQNCQPAPDTLLEASRANTTHGAILSVKSGEDYVQWVMQDGITFTSRESGYYWLDNKAIIMPDSRISVYDQKVSGSNLIVSITNNGSMSYYDPIDDQAVGVVPFIRFDVDITNETTGETYKNVPMVFDTTTLNNGAAYDNFNFVKLHDITVPYTSNSIYTITNCHVYTLSADQYGFTLNTNISWNEKFTTSLNPASITNISEPYDIGFNSFKVDITMELNESLANDFLVYVVDPEGKTIRLSYTIEQLNSNTYTYNFSGLGSNITYSTIVIDTPTWKDENFHTITSTTIYQDPSFEVTTLEYVPILFEFSSSFLLIFLLLGSIILFWIFLILLLIRYEDTRLVYKNLVKANDDYENQYVQVNAKRRWWSFRERNRQNFKNDNIDWILIVKNSNDEEHKDK